MKVLVACEFSGVVRDAFRAKGHDAVSCDLLPTEKDGPHIQADLRTVNVGEYDLGIFFPPCTHLCVSGARWFKDKAQEQADALEFVRWIIALPIPKIAIENPIGVISTKIRKPDQVIQPWQFGHSESKATCLWLKNLPKLQPTNVVKGTTLFKNNTAPIEERIHNMPPSPERSKERSRTYEGIAAAMAEQWG